jgi:hypothetical protein
MIAQDAPHWSPRHQDTAWGGSCASRVAPVVVARGDERLLIVKGAPESVLAA